MWQVSAQGEQEVNVAPSGCSLNVVLEMNFGNNLTLCVGVAVSGQGLGVSEDEQAKDRAGCW